MLNLVEWNNINMRMQILTEIIRQIQPLYPNPNPGGNNVINVINHAFGNYQFMHAIAHDLNNNNDNPNQGLEQFQIDDLDELVLECSDLLNY